jgi:hypothetical protein
MASTAQKPETTEKKPKSQATLLVQQVREDRGTELFHTPDRSNFVSVDVAGHRETYPIKSSAFRSYLRRLFFEFAHKAPSATVILDAVNLCEALAGDSAAPVHKVFLRVAEDESNCLWLDLGDQDWMAVKVSSAGWEICKHPEVRFRRAPSAMPLCYPEMGGSISDLRSFLNLTKDSHDHDFLLILSWLCAAFRPKGPYPILVMSGEHGSAKSTTCRVLRELVDPYKAPLRCLCRDERDLHVAAQNSHVVAIDNVSRIPDWLSDAFCRLATGGGLSTRELYTDAEEFIFDAQRPQLLNAIGVPGTRGDFCDRSIVIDAPPLSPKDRDKERTFWNRFRLAQPRILGAILTALSGGLRQMELGVNMPESPRMADFAEFSIACETSLGFRSGSFVEAYQENARDAVSVVLEEPAAQLLVKFAEKNQDGWKGTATELLNELTFPLPVHDKTFPRSANAFSTTLKRLAPGLRSVGVNLIFGHKAHGGRRLIEITSVAAK